MSVGLARRFAADHPGATLPCPACPATVKGANLARHLERTHPGFDGGGLGPRLRLDGDRLVARRRLLPDTRVDLPAPVVIGGARSTRTAFDLTGGEVHNQGVEVAAGTYLQVGAVVVRCRQGGGARSCWTGWQQGPRRRRWHVTVDVPAFAALQYELAARGVLRPVSAP